MAHFIRGKLYFNKNVEEYDIILGIKPTKLLIIDYDSGRYLRKIPFDKIIKWGKTNSEFCIVIEMVGEVHIQMDDPKLAANIF
jgi:hypothetical protein